MHKGGRLVALDMVTFFGGHSVMAAVIYMNCQSRTRMLTNRKPDRV